MPALAVFAVAAATAAAVVVPCTVIGSASGHHRAFTPAPAVRTDGQVIGFHGIVLTVPTSWHVNDTRCGTPVADTVIRDEGGTPLCLVRRSRGVSSVELLDDVASWNPQIRHVSEVRNGYGVQLRRGTIAGGGEAVVVPAAGVVMFLDTTSSLTSQRILDSVQVVDTDTTGCRMRQGNLDPPPRPALRGAPFRHYNVRYVVPPDVSSIAVCHYVDGWLAAAVTVQGEALAHIVHEANSAPAGLAHAAGSDLPSICSQPMSRGGEAGSGFVLHAHYTGRPDLLLWAHLGHCGPLGITNGLRSGQLSPALADAITAPLHLGVAIP
jgi:hypothetical protein